MESLLARAEEATKSLSRPEVEAPTWPPAAAFGQELFAQAQKEHAKAKTPLGVESARRLAAAAAAALRLSWAIGLATPADITEWRQFLEDSLQEALQVPAAADPQWMNVGLGRLPKELTQRKSRTESVEALLRQLDFFDQLLFRLWAQTKKRRRRGDGDIRHPVELSEAACECHLQRKPEIRAALQSRLFSTKRATKRAVLWDFRKAWLLRGAGPPWKAAPLPLRFLRARWLEASCLVELYATTNATNATDRQNRLQKAVLNWQLAGRDASARCHGFAVPSARALKILKKSKYSRGGLVELGAGVGYWAALLRRRGVDVVALDIDPPEDGDEIQKVDFGDASSLKKLSCDMLLLCMPPPGEPSCADRALKQFRGNYVAYVGEWSTGMTGTKSFHETLRSRYVLEHRVPLPCFPSMRAECYVFRKRSPKREATKHGELPDLLTCDECGSAAALYLCPETRHWRLCSEACYTALADEQASLLRNMFCGIQLEVPAWRTWKELKWLAEDSAGGQRWDQLKCATPQPEIAGWRSSARLS